MDNHTPYPAGLARMLYRKDRVAAAALVRVTYDLNGEELVPSDTQPWLVSNEPWEGPQGAMASDLVFYRGGVDVFLFANAVPEGGRPTTQMEVAVHIGEQFSRRVWVFGPRVWQRRPGGLEATAPRPFSSMPLELGQAYGGEDDWDGLTVPYVENPEGRGFYLSEDSAVARPLPHIEDPEHLIEKWDERPSPVGLVPMPLSSPLRAKTGVAQFEGGRVEIKPRFFNAAFPEMVASHVDPGDLVMISGVSASGPLRLRLPYHRLCVRLRFGTEVYEHPLAIDQVGFEVEARRVFIAYRFPFRYVLHELQERSCELFEGAPAAESEVCS
ncbi:DUF2169 domain-containing protein [Pseudenhygromyxa sp. WMMC2535]|uniref:DUF2169 domain-containing protein n=1 Tax=Pseudenhygromyxa sp. WMMC2535 TaxID=2712867 RepID=UPI0015960C5E|nr:DUF2169 domain-containing protein [Pseudenhygromyxa sp. WMMC2535]NVB37692.1 DUF2169 domain-containing protein [Pseudenhygromyxa sp. WMMC2535]